MILSETLLGCGPNCQRDDCMITENGMSTQTLAYYPPIYNKQGVNTNPNMNVTTRPVRCLSCGKAWTERWQNGVRISVEQ